MKTFVRCVAVGLLILTLGMSARADVIFDVKSDTENYFQGTFQFAPTDSEPGGQEIFSFVHFGNPAQLRFRNPDGTLRLFPEIDGTPFGYSTDPDLPFGTIVASYDLSLINHTFGPVTGDFESVVTSELLPFSFTGSTDSNGVLFVTFEFGTAPVPEPSSCALLIVAGVIGGGLAYRHRKLAVS